MREFNISSDSFKGIIIKEKGKSIYDIIQKTNNTYNLSQLYKLFGVIEDDDVEEEEEEEIEEEEDEEEEEEKKEEHDY